MDNSRFTARDLGGTPPAPVREQPTGASPRHALSNALLTSAGAIHAEPTTRPPTWPSAQIAHSGHSSTRAEPELFRPVPNRRRTRSVPNRHRPGPLRRHFGTLRKPAGLRPTPKTLRTTSNHFGDDQTSRFGPTCRRRSTRSRLARGRAAAAPPARDAGDAARGTASCYARSAALFDDMRHVIAARRR